MRIAKQMEIGELMVCDGCGMMCRSNLARPYPPGVAALPLSSGAVNAYYPKPHELKCGCVLFHLLLRTCVDP